MIRLAIRAIQQDLNLFESFEIKVDFRSNLRHNTTIVGLEMDFPRTLSLRDSPTKAELSESAGEVSPNFFYPTVIQSTLLSLSGLETLTKTGQKQTGIDD